MRCEMCPLVKELEHGSGIKHRGRERLFKVRADQESTLVTNGTKRRIPTKSIPETTVLSF